MKWDYSEDLRDDFSKGIHRDILIVPHATKVEKVAGGPPLITNKRPVFEWKKSKKQWQPKKVNGEFVFADVDWTITNKDIVKEKFKYSYSLNSDDNLSFSSCNAAMVQFTIRNKKEYVQYEDSAGHTTDDWYWEQEVPNLQYYEFIQVDNTDESSEKKITGQLEGNYIIEVYEYFNGDSSSLIYLGMFRVEEDKVTGNGYERQITAYDFMATFRDMDIFYWYKHLFTGINKLDNDYLDSTSTEDEDKETTKPDNYDDPDNWVRKPAKELFEDTGGYWTIGAALQDLINNLAAYDMVVYEKVKDEEKSTKEKVVYKYVPQIGNTIDNPSEYGRDDYEEGNPYTGLGMPVMLDPDILNPNATRSIPTEPGADALEHYGYMDILELPFMENPKIMKSESLSMGKFLEDIGMLAGRYPFIRTDKIDDANYTDPKSITPTETNPYPNKYQNYERCILSFKPLPSAVDDDKVASIPDAAFSNHEIAKGFQHDYYTVENVMIINIPLDDDTKIEYKRLNKTQRNAAKNGASLQTFNMPNNMFASYLVTKSDDDEIKKLLPEYKTIREKLFGTETKNGNMSAGALFQNGYLNIKNRTYVPYQLTTYGDPVRDCGDRIKIEFSDKITGEQTSFYTYILERSLEGIQKQMDTYTAKGDFNSPTFSNYQTGTKYSSGSNYSTQSSGYNKTASSSSGTGGGLVGMTAADLIQYWRNVGIRLLDEPTDCSAKFVKGTVKGDDNSSESESESAGD